MAHPIKHSWHAASPTPHVAPKISPALKDRKAPAEMLTLTLGDFLDRIPKRFLDGQEHDPAMPLPFDLGAVSERIGRGSPDIPVIEIYRRVPDIFSQRAVIDPELTIRFPWGKVLSLITQAREGPAAAGLTKEALEMLSIKVKARKFRRAPKVVPRSRERAPAAENRQPQTEPEITPVSAAPEPERREIHALQSVSAPVAAEVLRIVPDAPSDSAAALELARLKADYEQKLATVAEERDNALANLDPLRREFAGHLEQVAIERREAAAVREKFSLLQKEHGEIVRADSPAKPEQDADQNRTAELTTELTAEGDAAVSRTAELTAERDAAVSRTAELTAERDTAVSRTAELTAERDTAVSRATTLSADAEAAIALASELTAERDAVVARTADLIAERDSALARIAELSAERAAPAACVPELLKSPEETPSPSAPQEPQVDAATSSTPPPSEPVNVAREPEPDIYSTLFPQRFDLSRAAAAVVLGLVCLAIVISRIDFSSAPGAAAEHSTAPSALTVPDDSLPIMPTELTEEEKLSREVPAGELNKSLLPRDPRLGANGGQP